MKKINIPWARPLLGQKEKTALTRAFDSGWISGGYFVDQLEIKFSNYIGSRYGISTSSGTSAIYLALIALGIGKGDEVIVPGFCFAACVNMVFACGGRPVYVDIDENTWCINPRLVEKSITKHTKAVIAVHTYGNMPDMGILSRICKKHRLVLIEDAAEAIFSKYRQRYAGTIGHVGCFSFQATKTITTGEGGFIATSNKRLLDRMRLIRDHGMSKTRKYWNNFIGFNFRLTNLQASIGTVQINNAKKIICERRKIAASYAGFLKDTTGVFLQAAGLYVEPVAWTFAIKLDRGVFKTGRDNVMKKLANVGIETRPGFYAFSNMPVYKAPLLPVSANISRNIICLPLFCGLKHEQVYYICKSLKSTRKRP